MHRCLLRRVAHEAAKCLTRRSVIVARNVDAHKGTPYEVATPNMKGHRCCTVKIRQSGHAVKNHRSGCIVKVEVVVNSFENELGFVG